MMKNPRNILLPLALILTLSLAGCGDESDVVPEDNPVIDYSEGGEQQDTEGVQVHPPSNVDGENPTTGPEEQPRLREENTQAQGTGQTPPAQEQAETPQPREPQDPQTRSESQDQNPELVTPEGTEQALNEEEKQAAENAEPAVVIEMTDSYRFEPTTATIAVGDTVKWTNVGLTRHTVSTLREQATDSDNVNVPEGAEPFDSGEILPDSSWSYTFTVPGEYRYFCVPHQSNGMVGVLHVEPGTD